MKETELDITIPANTAHELLVIEWTS